MSSNFADSLSRRVRVLSMRLSSGSVTILVFNVSASFDVKLARERKTSLAPRQVSRCRCSGAHLESTQSRSKKPSLGNARRL
jgi:hypothetical protein